MSDTYIGEYPPRSPSRGMVWENQCARCGSSVDLDYVGEDAYCVCLSSVDWCEANPLPGREAVRRGELEWFEIEIEEYA